MLTGRSQSNERQCFRNSTRPIEPADLVDVRAVAVALHVVLVTR